MKSKLPLSYIIFLIIFVSSCNIKNMSEVPNKISKSQPNINQDLYVDLKTGNDPSHLLGRFVSDGQNQPMSASRATQTRCSTLIDVKTTDSGVSYDEVFSAHASGSFGGKLPTGVAGFDVETSENNFVRIRYQIRRVMEAVPKNEFFDCCEQYPDQCTGSYLSRFIYGGGQVFSIAGNAGEVSAGVQQTVSMGLDVKWGLAWQQETSFDGIYFGFELSPVQATGGVCASAWDKGLVPQRPDGDYFIGTSSLALVQADSRDAAERDARMKVVIYLFGEYLTQDVHVSTDQSQGLQANNRAMQAASEGIARDIKILCYAPYEEKATPKGKMYQTQALLFLPHSARAQYTRTALDSILSVLEINDPQRTHVEKLRQKVSD